MERMLPYSVEQSILEGRLEVKQLFEFVVNNAEAMDAYSMEAAIFARIMGIGLEAMKGYLSSSMNMGPPDFHKHGTTFEGGGGNRTGLPGKSGVGGGILAIVPGKFAIAVFSPPLDEAGNSVRGRKAIEYVAETLKANLFSIP